MTKIGMFLGDVKRTPITDPMPIARALNGLNAPWGLLTITRYSPTEFLSLCGVVSGTAYPELANSPKPVIGGFYGNEIIMEVDGVVYKWNEGETPLPLNCGVGIETVTLPLGDTSGIFHQYWYRHGVLGGAQQTDMLRTYTGMAMMVDQLLLPSLGSEPDPYFVLDFTKALRSYYGSLSAGGAPLSFGNYALQCFSRKVAGLTLKYAVRGIQVLSGELQSKTTQLVSLFANKMPEGTMFLVNDSLPNTSFAETRNVVTAAARNHKVVACVDVADGVPFVVEMDGTTSPAITPADFVLKLEQELTDEPLVFVRSQNDSLAVLSALKGLGL